MRAIAYALAACFFVSTAAAQTISITPTIGRFTADKPLGLIAPTGPEAVLLNATTVSVGVELQTGWPVLSLRATASTTVNGGIGRRVDSGSESCGPSCYHSLYQIHPLKDGASIMNLAVGTVFRPLPTALIRPHLIVGVGIKRMDLGKERYFDGTDFYSWGGRAAAFAVNLGAGLSIPLGMTRLELEGIDYISGFRSNTVIERSFYYAMSERSLQQLRHDCVLSAGIRVRVH